jgi:hypothetical protein
LTLKITEAQDAFLFHKAFSDHRTHKSLINGK